MSYDPVTSNSREDGEETYTVPVGKIDVSVRLQHWCDRDTGEPLGPTYHLYLPASGIEIYEDPDSLTDWALPCRDDRPTEGELRAHIKQAHPELLLDEEQ